MTGNSTAGHLLLLVCMQVATSHGAWAQQVNAGRDFPKTLTFDEPGIDDEISLPTLVLIPSAPGGGHETDLDFELDKRLTPRASVQINTGYTRPPLAGTQADGWQNVQVTLKYVVLSDPADERLVSLSLSREFGGSGSARIGAPAVGSTMLAGNFGQGASPFTVSPWIRPFAVTGSLGYAIPDRALGAASQQAIASLSAQYSFDVLAGSEPGLHVPVAIAPIIPIAECVYLAPTDGRAKASVTLAPGLIYAGNGFQLAAEALVPLIHSAGRHVGAIAQLNISLAVFGQTRLSQPIWP